MTDLLNDAMGREKEMTDNNRTIILNRMYAGSYLDENIGHEVINLFRDDNGDNYIYINQSGKIGRAYYDHVEAVLLVRYVEKGVMEVLAKAEGLEQVYYQANNSESGWSQEDGKRQIAYIKDKDIRYGGAFLHDIYGNIEEGEIAITFKANVLRKPKRKMYLIEDGKKTGSYGNYVLLPEKHFSNQSLKMYYTEGKLPKDYRVLEGLISNKELWEKKNTTEKLNVADYKGMAAHSNILSIIGKEDDELVFSNLFAHFFEEDRLLFKTFAKEVLGINDLQSDFDLVRESMGNIDLWIEDDFTVIIIENKIKSKINGERHDIYSPKVQSQLSKYYLYAKKECPDKDIRCYIFSPDYNAIDIRKYEAGKYYSIVNYSKIYDFYLGYAGRMIHSRYFPEFLDAINMHSKPLDTRRFEIMRERFISKIVKKQDNY